MHRSKKERDHSKATLLRCVAGVTLTRACQLKREWESSGKVIIERTYSQSRRFYTVYLLSIRAPF